MTDTPLGRKIKADIAANGPISVADFMARCLLDPAQGYYATRDPLGAAGDFVTAPEVSQMFGELIGAWLAHAWELIDRPRPARLVELGPGRGTLMADMLRVVAVDAELSAALTVHLVEASPALRNVQRRTLADAPMAIEWHDRIETVPAGAILLVANEFFDALPVRQLVRAGGRWHERVVGLDRTGDLAFAVGAAALPAVPGFDDAAGGAILELRPAADSIVDAIAERISTAGGAALLVDFGHGETALGDTLQAVRAHQYADPLGAPGLADLTAHVDFAALSRSAATAGVACHGPIGQGAFLAALGIHERAVVLARSKRPGVRRVLRRAVERLTAGNQMGHLFKVMALTRPGFVPPPFCTGSPAGV